MWQEIVPGVREQVRTMDSGWSQRTVALDVGGGRDVVVSPTRKLDPGERKPAFLLAPNHFHYLGIPEWSARFPDARVVASARAAPRIAEKLSRSIDPLDVLAAELPPHVRLLTPEGTKNGEVWVEVDHDGDRTWIVCDAFFNAPRTPSGLTGLGCWLTGTTPGLRIGGTWFFLHLEKRAVYKQWLEATLEARAPTRLVPAHGDVLEGADVRDRLLALTRARL